MDVFLKLKWHFLDQKASYLTGILCLIGVSILELVPPLLIGFLVDDIANKTVTTEKTLKLIGVLLLAGLGMYILRVSWRILIYNPAFRLSTVLREKLFRHFSLRSSTFFQRHSTGDLMAHATNDVKAVEAVAGDGVLVLADSGISFLTVIGMMALFIDWRLTLLAFIPFPILALAIYFFASWLHHKFIYAQEKFSELNSRSQETISGIKAVKGHHLYDLMTTRFKDKAEANRKAYLEVAKIDLLFEPSINVCMTFSFLLTLGFGAYLISTSALSIGQLTTFTMYLSMLIWPMFAFGWLFSLVEKGSASYERLEKLLKMGDDFPFSNSVNPEESNSSNQNTIEKIQLSIDEFIYPDHSKLSLSKVNLALDATSFIGITGPTGSGKTTLLKIFTQDYFLVKGSITLNHLNVQELHKEDWWRNIAYVPQEPFIFSGTVYENIAFAVPGVSKESIYEAAKQAYIHDEILSFPQGYNTILGERGVNLSGGQKQRLTIARALITQRPILVLDDAFSALDLETESNILQSIRQQSQDKIVILATHRVLNLKEATEILVLRHNKISERGNHSDLLAATGWYAMIHEQQQSQSLDILSQGTANNVI